MKSLSGLTAVVTGASRGIGATIARRLAAEGVRLALVARTEAALHEVATATGGSPVVAACDVTDRNSVAAAAARIREAFGGSPDILVNNAGTFKIGQIHELPPEDFVVSIGTNLFAPFLMLHEFLGGMRERGSGHIVTIGSLGDRKIFTENGAYSASKFGLRALHEVLRAELDGTGVRATLISPASVNTALWNDIDTESGELDMPTRNQMLDAGAVARAVMFALTQPEQVNIDELRLSRA